MKFLSLLPILIVSLFSLHSAADDKYELSTFDILAVPRAGLGLGRFAVDGVDSGNFASLTYGGKFGFKVGPLLLGGDYLEGITTAESLENGGVSDLNRRRYPLPDQASVRSIGASVGLSLSRLSLWATYYPVETLTKNAIVAGIPFEHIYHGTGASVEAMVRVWNLVHVGLSYHTRVMKSYTSTHTADLADKAELDPTLRSHIFGVTLSYLIPYSQVKEFIK